MQKLTLPTVTGAPDADTVAVRVITLPDETALTELPPAVISSVVVVGAVAVTVSTRAEVVAAA